MGKSWCPVLCDIGSGGHGAAGTPVCGWLAPSTALSQGVTDLLGLWSGRGLAPKCSVTLVWGVTDLLGPWGERGLVPSVALALGTLGSPGCLCPHGTARCSSSSPSLLSPPAALQRALPCPCPGFPPPSPGLELSHRCGPGGGSRTRGVWGRPSDCWIPSAWVTGTGWLRTGDSPGASC